MADPKTPNIPSLAGIDINNANEVAQALDKIHQAAEKLGGPGAEALEKVGRTLMEVSKQAQASTQSFSLFKTITELETRVAAQFGISIRGANDELKVFGNITQGLAKGASILGTALLGPADILKSIGGDSTLDTISGQVSQLIDKAGDAADPLAALAKSLGIKVDFSKLGNIAGIQELKREITNVGDGIDKSLNMERAVVKMSAQSGQLNTLFRATGGGVKNLGAISEEYSQKLANIREMTGTTAAEMGRYFNSIQKLPAAYKDNKDSSLLATNQMEKLNSILTLAHGTGQDFDAVLSQTNTMLETYNGTAEAAYDLTARSSELSKTYGATLSLTTGYLTEMAGAFKFLGDNTESASGIFSEMFQGLRDGGLGMKPSIDTITQMTSSIASLNVAQKAFLSSRSGGPGGLLGSVQIEKQLAAGDSQGVFDKLRKAFTQQAGGKIITRDEVQTQAQASQFEKQRQLLKSSAFGGVAKTDEQASAILKAFSEANKGGNVTNAKDLLRDTMKQGVDYQKLSATSLQNIEGDLNKITTAGGFAALAIAQNAVTGVSGDEKIASPLAARREKAKTELETPSTGMDQSDKHIRTGLSNLPGDVDAGKQILKHIEAQANATHKSPYAALHQAAVSSSNTKGTTPASHAPTHPATTTSTANTPITNVNVYIDGKKIMPDRVQASHSSAIGPAGPNN